MPVYLLTYDPAIHWHLLLGCVVAALLIAAVLLWVVPALREPAPVVEPVDVEARVMPYIRQYQMDRAAAQALRDEEARIQQAQIERAMLMHPAKGHLSIEDTLRSANLRRLAVVVNPDER